MKIDRIVQSDPWDGQESCVVVRRWGVRALKAVSSFTRYEIKEENVTVFEDDGYASEEQAVQSTMDRMDPDDFDRIETFSYWKKTDG